MSKIISLSSHPELKRVIMAAFPRYRKTKCFLSETTRVEISGTAWDGGSRSSYAAVELATGRSMPAPQYAPPQFGGPRVALSVEIPAGVVIVEAGIFMGKPAIASIFVRPENLTKLIEGTCGG